MRERRERDGKVVCKASLRSNPPLAVGPVAQGYGGGGHLQAAGCTIPGTLAEVSREWIDGHFVVPADTVHPLADL